MHKPLLVLLPVNLLRNQPWPEVINVPRQLQLAGVPLSANSFFKSTSLCLTFRCRIFLIRGPARLKGNLSEKEYRNVSGFKAVKSNVSCIFRHSAGVKGD
jgi:hypothetical protein